MQRIEGSGVEGTREAGALQIAESRGARPSELGMPTVYRECQSLTKEERPCKAPPANGGPYCVGHARQRGLVDGDTN